MESHKNDASKMFQRYDFEFNKYTLLICSYQFEFIVGAAYAAIRWNKRVKPDRKREHVQCSLFTQKMIKFL